MTRASTRVLTRIVATLGPAVAEPAVLRRLIEQGAGLLRLNFSHGDLAEHAARVIQVRRLAAEIGLPVAILGDLPGPKIRVGKVAGEGAQVTEKDVVLLARGTFVADPQRRPLRLSSTYPQLLDELAVGQRVLIDDGAVRLVVVDVGRDEARCEVLNDGRVSSGKGINLPDTTLSATALGERDRLLTAWAVEQELDFLALSFVTSAEEVRSLRAIVAQSAAALGRPAAFRLPIVAKIERPQAVARIAEICAEADAIMVARGDLGVEMDYAEVPLIQMRLLEAAHAAGRPCIVATQMLQSMVEAPAPTRAEASDVATAILAGADAVMLSAETAIGRWPVGAVQAMARVAAAAERWHSERPRPDRAGEGVARTGYPTAALAHGAWHIARDNRVACVVVWSQAGGGARYLSQNDFDVPIVAFSSDQRAVRQMCLLRGVWPVHWPEVPESIAAWRPSLTVWLERHGWAAQGQRVLLVAGEPLGIAGVTNGVSILSL